MALVIPILIVLSGHDFVHVLNAAYFKPKGFRDMLSTPKSPVIALCAVAVSHSWDWQQPTRYTWEWAISIELISVSLWTTPCLSQDEVVSICGYRGCSCLRFLTKLQQMLTRSWYTLSNPCPCFWNSLVGKNWLTPSLGFTSAAFSTGPMKFPLLLVTAQHWLLQDMKSGVTKELVSCQQTQRCVMCSRTWRLLFSLMRGIHSWSL